MAAVLPPNLLDPPNVEEDRRTWHTAQRPNQEDSAKSAVRKPSDSSLRTRLSNGPNPASFNSRPLYSPEHKQNLRRNRSGSLVNSRGGYGASNLNLSTYQEDEIPENMYRLEDYDPNTEKWIHRDKLAKIESEELQAAGYHLAAQSGARARRTQSADRLREGRHRPDQYDPSALERDTRQWSVSPPVYEAEDNRDGRDWDLRIPEEIASTDYVRGDKGSGTLAVRKNGSKIPVLTSSPLPIPAQRLDRDTPLRRKRTTSGSIQDDDTPVSSRSRRRRSSAGGQPLIDEADSNAGTPLSSSAPRSGSRSLSAMTPTASKAGLKAAVGTPTNANSSSATRATSPPSATRKMTPGGARKASTVHKARISSDFSTTSPVQLQQQSTGRGGETPERPRTAVNRPEGEAPWIATMYKPDPRLPPDQQIIPTHAKKQQQQRPEHDTISSPLPPPPPSPPPPENRVSSDENRPHAHHQDPCSPFQGSEMKARSLWPPTNSNPSANGNAKSVPNSRRPSTSHSTSGGSSIKGGYSTMPKLSNHNNNPFPAMASSPFAPAPGPGQDRKGSISSNGQLAGVGSHSSANNLDGAGRVASQQQQRQPFRFGTAVNPDEGPYGDDGREVDKEDGSGNGRRRGCGGCCIVM